MTIEPAPASKLPWIVAAAVGCVGFGLAAVLGIALLVVVARAPAGPSSPGTPGAPTASGVVSGVVLDEVGKPVSAPGAVVTVIVRGTSDRGERQVLTPAVGADGRYEIRPPAGLYSVEGTVELTFEGRRYRFTLDPASGARPVDRSSAAGIREDFVWKLTGAIPGRDPGQPIWHYGGYLHPIGLHGVPKETRLTFQVESLGPRADGAPAQGASFTLTMGELEKNAFLGELPLARYRVSGTATGSDGPKGPLHFGGNDYASSAATVDVVFAPGGAGITDNVDPAVIYVFAPPRK